jgi:hypothetical protein
VGRSDAARRTRTFIPRLRKVLEKASSGGKSNVATRKKIEDKAKQHPQYWRCQWLGRCYYCYFAGRWWKIGCM